MLVSPYQLAKLISNELNTTIAPQRVYAEVRKDKIKSTRNELNHLCVDTNEVQLFVERYNAKQQKKEQKTQVDS